MKTLSSAPDRGGESSVSAGDEPVPGAVDSSPVLSTADPLRVGFVVHKMQVAGAEMLVAETVRRMSGRIQPTILCLDAVGRLGRQLQDEGIEVTCLGRRPGVDLGVSWRLARAVRRRRIEVLHAHQYTPFFYSALSRLLAGGNPALILTEHGRHYPDLVSRRRRWLNRLLLSRLATHVTACCEFSRDALATVDGFDARRIEVIENGIALPRYERPEDRKALRERLGLEADRRYIACVARFHAVKDHETLVRAFARVATERLDVDLLLIGGGPLEQEIRGLVSELELAPRVRFLGIRSDVPEILGAADLFALTSLSEAASLTLLEALASGLPVVVTQVGGNPEIVEDGVHGRLVPRQDLRATAEAMMEILDDPALTAAMAAAGPALVAQRFRLEGTIERFAELYRTLAARSRRPEEI